MKSGYKKNKIKLALTGSAGFIGTNFRLYNDNRFEILPISDINNIKETNLEGTDTIVHLAGLTNLKTNTSAASFLKVNFELTCKLASVAKKAKVKQFVFLSTTKVYASSSKEKITETSSCNPLEAYGKSKLLAEKYLSSIETPDFKIGIIRSPIVYGPGVKGKIFNLIKFSDTFFPLPFKNINAKFSAVFVDNLIALVNKVIVNEERGVFLAADQRPISLLKLSKFMRLCLGRKDKFFALPSFIYVLIKNINENIFNRLLYPTLLDTAKTNKRLNYIPPFSTYYGILKTIKWYKNSHSKKTFSN